MAKRAFKCPRCDRRFSMAAHLGRHMSTIHALRRKSRPRRKTAAVQSSPTTDVIGHVEAARRELAAHRSELDAQITAMDRVLKLLRQR